jgi:hypothetical protein
MGELELPAVLTAYSDLKFIDAIGTVLRERAGQVMTPETVTNVLFGDLSG